MDRRVNLHDLSKRFFHPDECDEINAQPEDQQRKAFFNCWTRKEAYIKALGKGLYLPLDSFCVSVDDESPKLLWRDQSTEDQVAWQIDSFHPQKDYVVALFRPSDLTYVERFTFSLDS